MLCRCAFGHYLCVYCVGVCECLCASVHPCVCVYESNTATNSNVYALLFMAHLKVSFGKVAVMR